MGTGLSMEQQVRLEQEKGVSRRAAGRDVFALAGAMCVKRTATAVGAAHLTRWNLPKMLFKVVFAMRGEANPRSCR